MQTLEQFPRSSAAHLKVTQIRLMLDLPFWTVSVAMSDGRKLENDMLS